MKKNSLLFVFILAIGFGCRAQSAADILKPQLNLKHIKGLYNTTQKSFYSKNIDSLFNEHEYTAGKFYGNAGVLKYTFLSKNKQLSFEYFGIVDTNGHILIPCIYDELTIPSSAYVSPENNKHYITVVNFDYCIFKKNDSIGIVIPGNKIIYQIPLKVSIKGNLTYGNIYPWLDSVRNQNDYCLIRANDKLGLFSVNLQRVIVPPQFNNIQLYNHNALCKTEKNYVVYNCHSGQSSLEYSVIRYLKNGSFLIRDKQNKLLVCDNIFEPENSRNKNLTRNATVEYFNHHFILNDLGKFGLVNENENTIIPFVYDNIYFFDINFLLLKQNETWAIANYKHELLSDFIYFDIDKQNGINFKNLMDFLNEDSLFNSANTVSPIRVANEITQLDERTQRDIQKLFKQIDSHILSDYGDDITKQYVLKKKDGFHITDFYSHHTNIKLDSTHWDNIYQLPGSATVGVQLGKKFGYCQSNTKLNHYLKYDGIRYIQHCAYSWQRNLLFRNGDRFYSTSPFTVIKHGDIYYHKSSFIPWENHDERNRWVKYRKVKK